MHVLVLGATGYIGSAVVAKLSAAGHRVTAVSRTAPATDLPGVTPVRGDLLDPTAVAALVTHGAIGTDSQGAINTGIAGGADNLSAGVAGSAGIDAVIHTAAPQGDAELPVIDALTRALAGSGRPLVWTSGVWVLGPTGDQPGDETTPAAPIAIVAARPGIEDRVLAAARQGVRAVVLRPGVVHGRGGGILAMLAGWARELGHGRWVGGPETSPRWPLVHVDDLADLYVLAATRAEAGTVLHGVAESGVRTATLARAAAHGAGITAGTAGTTIHEAGSATQEGEGSGPGAYAWPQEEAAAELGAPFAEALALDQEVTAARSLALGWQPSGPTAAEDLATGSYATVPVTA